MYRDGGIFARFIITQELLSPRQIATAGSCARAPSIANEVDEIVIDIVAGVRARGEKKMENRRHTQSTPSVSTLTMDSLRTALLSLCVDTSTIREDKSRRLFAVNSEPAYSNRRAGQRTNDKTQSSAVDDVAGQISRNDIKYFVYTYARLLISHMHNIACGATKISSHYFYINYIL